jgi:RHS repeat-associated protein
MRFFCTIAVTAGVAGAQCYSFTGPGASYSMNIMSVTSTTMTSSPPVNAFIVQQQSILTFGGKVYTATAGPASVTFEGVENSSIFSTGFIDPVDIPVWQADVTLASNNLTLVPSAPPASLPPISSWTVEAMLEFSIGGGAAISVPITAVGSCSSGAGTFSVPGVSLGDTKGQPGSCNCNDPIDLGSGNLFQKFTDYQVAGMNKLGFTRYYNSLGNKSSLAQSLGPNWRSNFDRYLRLSASQITAERADGKELIFTPTGSTWATQTDFDVTLTNSGNTWTLVDKDDTIETYTAVSATEAQLQTIQTRNGYTQTIQYDASNHLTAVTDSYNRQLAMTYQNGLLQSVTTPDGLVLTFGFTTGQLTSVQYSTSPVTTQTYLYENSSRPTGLTGIIDEDGNRYATWTFDSNGRALTGQLGGGAALNTIVYNDTDGSRTVTNPLGEQEKYTFTTLQNAPKLTGVSRISGGGIAAASRAFTYDSNGYLASATDWNGNLTNFVNNAHGEPTSIVEAAGSAQARTTTISYHPSFHLPVQVVSQGLTVALNYDNNGQLLTKTLTDTTSTSVPYSTNGQTRTWTYTWSNFLLSSIKSPRTDINAAMKFSYDSSGALTSVANTLGQTVQITAHTPGGRPQTIIDLNGVQSTFSYDARQRLLTSTLTTAAGALTTKYSYDSAGDLLTVTQPDGSALTETLDAAHRVTGYADTLGNTLRLVLDPAGDRTAATISNPAGNATRQHSGVFDALGRMIQDVGGAGQTTAFTYDANGNRLTIMDPVQRTTAQTFDALNRMVKITNPAQGATTITHDVRNRPLTITDPNGGVTTYTYDGFGDLIHTASPARGTTAYHFDANGNLLQQVDARGVVTNYAYDSLDRVISVSYPADPAENVTYTYDQTAGGFGIGRVTSVTDAAGSLSRSYDERGDLLSESRVFGSGPSAVTLQTGYTYDAAGRVASITYPSGTKIAYTRDGMGRITGATALAKGSSEAATVVSGAGYEPFGLANGFSYGNGISESRLFDLDYRMTTISSSGGQPVENLSYGYNAANDVTSVTDGVTAANSQTFGYDALDRLTGATGGYGSLAYGYDANGNRLTETPAAPITLDGLGGVSMLAYNNAGRLASTSAGAASLTQYTYNAFGQRLMKVGSATGTSLFAYTPSNQLLEETDGQGNVRADYIYLNGKPVAEYSAGKLYFLHGDRLGTPQAVTDATQSNIWSASYQPFGALSASSRTALIGQDLRLPGQENDMETGLYHNGFRDYVPGWGRFGQSDPIGMLAGTNTYTYSLDNPATFFDPSGMDTITLNYYGMGGLAKDLFYGGTGHVGVSVNGGPSYGYYPIDALNIGPDAMLGSVWGQGVEIEDLAIQGHGPSQSATFTITPDQAQAATDYINGLTQNPGTYNFVTNNCTTVAQDILGVAGVNQILTSNGYAPLSGTMIPAFVIPGMTARPAWVLH